MGALEIILLAAGAVIFIASFCIPVKQEKLKEETKNLAAQEIKNMVAEEMDHVRGRLEELSEEEMQQQIEKSERSMERISNEKIMAVNEYSDTVLAEIRKNHEEVMFLYDMLNNKHTSLKNTVAEVNRAVKEAREAVKAMQKLSASGAAEARKEWELPVSAEEEKPLKPVPESFRGLEPPPLTVRNGEDEDAFREGEQERNNNERIMALYRQGKSATAIAKELGLGVGEVKLVIGLFRN